MKTGREWEIPKTFTDTICELTNRALDKAGVTPKQFRLKDISVKSKEELENFLQNNLVARNAQQVCNAAEDAMDYAWRLIRIENQEIGNCTTLNLSREKMKIVEILDKEEDGIFEMLKRVMK